MAMAVLMVLSAVIARRRRTGPPLTEGDPLSRPAPQGAQPLALAAERGLAAVEDLSRSPERPSSRAISPWNRRCPGPPERCRWNPNCTSEVLARAVGSQVLRSVSAAPLVQVFAEARFKHPHHDRGSSLRWPNRRWAVLSDVRSGS